MDAATIRVTAQKAQSLVLAVMQESANDSIPERYVVQTCELSACGRYWVIRVNTEAYVIHGKSEFCRVGLNASLVDVQTGEISYVYSGQSVESYLYDMDAVAEAHGGVYVLGPAFDKSDKAAFIKLRQKTACAYQEILALLSQDQMFWLTGKRRLLEAVRILLAGEEIATSVTLVADAGDAVEIDETVWHIDAVLSSLRQRISRSNPAPPANPPA